MLRDVLRTMVEHGAKVFDTAPSYGASEEVAGAMARELGITGKIFWATKVNVAGRGGGTADPAAARAEIEVRSSLLGNDANWHCLPFAGVSSCRLLVWHSGPAGCWRGRMQSSI